MDFSPVFMGLLEFIANIMTTKGQPPRSLGAGGGFPKSPGIKPHLAEQINIWITECRWWGKLKEGERTNLASPAWGGFGSSSLNPTRAC